MLDRICFDSPVIPWEIIPSFSLFENNHYRRKAAFLSISNIMSNAIGNPTASCILAGNIVGAASWERVSLDKQHFAITESAGIFEASAMTYLHFKGPDAAHVLNKMTPRNIHALKPDHAMFVIFTTPLGTVDDEAIVLRLAEDEFLVSCGGCKPSSNPLSFLHQAIRQCPNVIVNLPDIISFNIKGPKRVEAMMNLVCATDKNKILFLSEFQLCQANLLNGAPVWVVKTKIGMEMWGELSAISLAWISMLNQPDIYTPCGWDALHTFRMDCNEILFSLYPIDIHDGTSLWEIGCGWMVKEKDHDYIGKEALENGKNKKTFELKKLYAVSNLSRLAKIGARLYKKNGDIAGYITSSAFSIKAGRALAFAHLKLDCNQQEIYCLDETGDLWSLSGKNIT